jgi:hypothetical protein
MKKVRRTWHGALSVGQQFKRRQNSRFTIKSNAASYLYPATVSSSIFFRRQDLLVPNQNKLPLQ